MTGRDPEVDRVLAEQLGSLAGAATAVQGNAAARGTAWTAKRLKTETASAEHRFDPQCGDELVHALAQLLNRTPRDDTPGEQGDLVTVRGIIGSGFLGMNPTYVLAVVDPGHGKLAVAAHAKEGLIKQRSAEKAVHKVIAELPLG